MNKNYAKRHNILCCHMCIHHQQTFCMKSFSKEYGILIEIVVQCIPDGGLE